MVMGLYLRGGANPINSGRQKYSLVMGLYFREAAPPITSFRFFKRAAGSQFYLRRHDSVVLHVMMVGSEKRFGSTSRTIVVAHSEFGLHRHGNTVP
jgi:hypothetical protein